MNTQADSLTDIVKYYENNGEAFRFQRQQLEYLVTLQLLAHYLPPPLRVLELGAGAGAYTLELAKAGHRVVANDLCEVLLKQNEHEVKAAKLEAKVTFVPGDARAAAQSLEADSFDVVLAMGPLYHLVNEGERLGVLNAVKPLLKKTGKLITAHMTRTGFIKYVFEKSPELIATNPENIMSVWKDGFDPKHPRDGKFRGYWCSPEEAKNLHERAGFKWHGIHSQDPCVGSHDDHFNSFSMELKLSWSALLFRISADPSTWGDARHFLCISHA